MGYLNVYGVFMHYDPIQYKEAKEALKEAGKDICYEDILMEILKRGGSLTYRDIEGDGEMTSVVTLEDVHERMDNVPKTTLCNFLAGNNDIPIRHYIPK